MIGIYYAIGSEVSATFAHNVFQMTSTDQDIIRIVDGIDQNGMRLVFRDNEFIGRKAGTGNAAFVFFYDRFGQTVIEGNIFRNLDKAYRFINVFATNNDWAWGEVVRTDRNIYESVTTIFDLQPTTYCAVGTDNQYINCEPGFSRYIVPAKITNGIMTGYYVDALPDRKCRENDRLLSLTPLTTDFLEWHQTATLPAAKAFTVGAGDVATDIFNCTGHGLAAMDKIRFFGASLPAPIVAGKDYYVATVPTANTFKVANHVTAEPLNITASGSGTFQNRHVTAAWKSDIYSWLLRKPDLLNRWSGDGDSPNDYQGVQNMVWTGTPAYAAAPANKGGGKAFEFNGSSNYMTAPIPAYTTADKFTITFWLNKVALSQDSVIVNNRDAVATGWSLAAGTDGNLYLSAGTIGYLSITPAPVVVPGEWVFVALVANGTDSGLYVNATRRTTFEMDWVEPAFVANAGTDVITATAHGLADGETVRFAGASLPAPLVQSTLYYVRDSTANTFKVAATGGGAAIDITTAGTGTMVFVPLPDHLQIGASAFNGTFFLDGKLSDVRLYSKALTLSQILGLYNGPSFGY